MQTQSKVRRPIPNGPPRVKTRKQKNLALRASTVTWCVMHIQRLHVQLLMVDQRIFTYADPLSWTLNLIALVATIGAGASLPLLDFVLGKTVTTFNNFQTGSVDPAKFRSDAAKWAYVNAKPFTFSKLIDLQACHCVPLHRAICPCLYLGRKFFHPLRQLQLTPEVLLEPFGSTNNQSVSIALSQPNSTPRY